MNMEVIIPAVAAVTSGALSAFVAYLAATSNAKNNARGLFVSEFEQIAVQLRETRQAERDERSLRQALEDQLRDLQVKVDRQDIELEQQRTEIDRLKAELSDRPCPDRA